MSQRLLRRRVLVVDDNYDAREVFRLVVSSWGSAVVAAASARRALAVFNTWRPHVVVSDLAMPRNTGYWLVREIRKLPPEEGGTTPAIAVTAHASRHHENRARSAGFDAYLTKPVDLPRLRELVGSLMSRPKRRSGESQTRSTP
jgi:CheY-like chemotaxis protein